MMNKISAEYSSDEPTYSLKAFIYKRVYELVVSEPDESTNDS